MIKNRARGVPVDSCALMWMHHRRASGTLIKFDEGDYYGHFSRCAARIFYDINSIDDLL
ncbi:hypothetical protein ACWXWB_14895 [Pantoea dispersa]|uniref:hypothetical protein n=1 Tax=Pantoea dispersa TaxID=59814 RepID=UPI002DB8EB5F|nr:hypothetical protein [Pantoea dispersa]MEB5972643.1 hypothetical protein [Pantoea dispersa]